MESNSRMLSWAIPRWYSKEREEVSSRDQIQILYVDGRNKQSHLL